MRPGCSNINYGADLHGASFAFDIAALQAQGLASHGLALHYAWTPGPAGEFGPSGVLTAFVIEGSGPGAVEKNVFQVSVDGSVKGSAYTFTLLGGLDQPLHTPPGAPAGSPGSLEDTSVVRLPFTVSDGDKDSASGSLVINVNDDLPTAGTGARAEHLVNGNFEDTAGTNWKPGGDYGPYATVVKAWIRQRRP